jgi:hypothetical protein
MDQGSESEAKRAAFDWVEQNRRSLSDWNQVIWHYAEPALREYKSAAWYVDRLERDRPSRPMPNTTPSPATARWPRLARARARA